ncbi:MULTISPECIES: AraC family transcriptional regulator [unclassified Saccharopolyspora]|uniref:AraC family transcriptional regulator n=1 Tax=unclassified Saccharopolyspora TaxID=2646250 RepID=UPI001CD30198|nr:MULTISPECIES: AraC family transcriptional regulator [unclassified Saccharopolyspora]MCA1187015.1 AraC family transcriptional regulator [Saccharopolyspora sp. 6T]MCA1195601.1 AraC family transcriptional regulator [Saccharopolyspora sp. 6V]MCA1224804.1 AraC family transcriptional regulator [Saccharopolyspora sp. 6M]MCA1280152.1 AraC family transcriptional regulator [Saccharopolyspora sp. 7B]
MPHRRDVDHNTGPSPAAAVPDPVVQDWDFPRSSISALLLTRFAGEHSVPADVVLAGTGLTEPELEDPDLSVDAHQELRIVRNLVRALPDVPDLGMRAGLQYHLTAYGILGFAFISSPTVQDGMAVALRYLELSFAFCIPRVRFAGDELHVELDAAAIPADVRNFLIARDLSAIHTIMVELLPAPIPVQRIELSLPEQPNTAELGEFFGVVPKFGQPHDVIVLDPAFLGRPLPQANEQTLAMCEAQCRDLLAGRRERTGFAKQVRDQMLGPDGVRLGMEDVARKLHTTARTLHRKLNAEGTSFQSVRDEVRAALAEGMLRDGALSVDDIAIRLGYAEAASFIHAFKRWTGTTPMSYARRRGADR